MTPLSTLTSVAVPLPGVDINTDDIFPVTGLAGGGSLSAMLTDPDAIRSNAFRNHRYLPDGSLDPEFPFNQDPYTDGRILVTGRNFGCGSSREMAVWALRELGLRCIIAPSFADIFYENAINNGLLPVSLQEDDVATVTRLVSEQPGSRITVDLDARNVTCPDGSEFSFTIGSYHHHLLRNGLDEISATMRRMDLIEAYESTYYKDFPWTAAHSNL
jgi:3-isopropylmalate/(R)-2-methylmalate dehydratase small subunit